VVAIDPVPLSEGYTSYSQVIDFGTTAGEYYFFWFSMQDFSNCAAGSFNCLARFLFQAVTPSVLFS